MKNNINSLSWAILEFKLAYYHPNLIHPSWKSAVIVDDAIYDSVENEYKELCAKDNIIPSACNMVGFDMTRPCCRLVLSKLLEEKGSNLSVFETHVVRTQKTGN